MDSSQKNETAMKSATGPVPSDRRKRSRVLDAEVGQSIRQHRKNAKMTLQGLADRLGIAYQQVQKYETGVNRVGAGRLMEIAEILGVPVAGFFDASRGDAPEADSEAALQARQAAAAVLRIKDPHKRKTALAYLRSLTEGE
jgi:transcriptional regulator with XRE-family HTH domain